MRKPGTTTGMLVAAALGAAIMLPAAQQSQAQTRVEAGVLNCAVEGGAGFIIGSSKNLDCVFERSGANEHYVGTINKFGLDVGVTGRTVIVWTVLAPTNQVPGAALAGNYVGVSAEATAGAGLGANALIGGSDRSIALQPVSVQAQTGVNIALGVSSLTLRAVN